MRTGVRSLCRPVATQGLLALTTLCRDLGHGRNLGHGRDTRSKGLCCDKENLCRDPNHPVPTPNPVATPKFYRNTGPSNLCRDREFSFVTEELWAVCSDEDFLSRQVFCLVTVARRISVARAHTRMLCALLCAPYSCREHWCAPLRHRKPCRDRFSLS